MLGDQLDRGARLLREARPDRDVILMMEVARESQHAASHIQRSVLFLSAMRHFAADLRAAGLSVHYIAIDDPANTHSFSGELTRALRALDINAVRCTLPGEWRVLHELQSACTAAGAELEVLEDEHFICSRADFASWAKGRAGLTMEFFYRRQRQSTGYLMHNGAPVGGEWNFDKDNRESFGKDGPKPPPPRPRTFPPDHITLDVIRALRTVLPDLPGRLDSPEDFTWPVTRDDAQLALKDFISTRLPKFGQFEDAMWTDQPVVYHSTLSPLLNLKLLSPRECCDAAIAAHHAGKAPIQSVEAFVRQIIGWREFIRGVYWLEGPDYAQRNALDAHANLPDFYWTGNTDMNCLRQCVGQVLDRAYAHHIQRLMVMGNFALLVGVEPRKISDWYLGMFIDGVDWVTLPNVLGMVMHADRRPDAAPGVTGLVGTKPYAASGKYIDRMSNYCRDCRYDLAKRSGEDACPFNVMYWDFLIRHRDRFAKNQRMAMILKNVDRMNDRERVQITVSAGSIRTRLGLAAHNTPPASTLFDHKG